MSQTPTGISWWVAGSWVNENLTGGSVRVLPAHPSSQGSPELTGPGPTLVSSAFLACV